MRPEEGANPAHCTRDIFLLLDQCQLFHDDHLPVFICRNSLPFLSTFFN
jgi:hypothetical protein